jgi:hypothetical protein
VDTTAVVKGSTTPTKQLLLEVDGGPAGDSTWSVNSSGGIQLPAATATIPGLNFDGSPNAGIYSRLGVTAFVAGGTGQAEVTGSGFVTRGDRVHGWYATGLGTTLDTLLRRHSAGVTSLGDDTASSIRSLQGGGAAVASAAALPLPTGRVFHVTGTTTVTSITSTNFEAGVCITLIFDGILTFTDGGNLTLAGNFVTTADDTISLCYDGTNWFETGRAVN